MPKINEQWKDSNGYMPFLSLNNYFESDLPELAAFKLGGRAQKEAETEVQSQSIINSDFLQKKYLFETGLVNGIPKNNINNVVKFVKEIKALDSHLVDQVYDQVGDVTDIISEFVPQLTQLFSLAIGPIPVIGQIIGIARAVGSLIFRLARRGEKRPEKRIDICPGWQTWNADEDERHCRVIIREFLTKNDWSNIFLPTSYMDGKTEENMQQRPWVCLDLTDDKGVKLNKYRIESASEYNFGGSRLLDKSLGYLPGACIRINTWQGGIIDDYESWTRNGVFYPSGEQLVSTLWSAMQKPGVDCFKVMLTTIDSYWQEWGEKALWAGKPFHPYFFYNLEAINSGLIQKWPGVKWTQGCFNAGDNCTIIADLMTSITITDAPSGQVVYPYSNVEDMREAIKNGNPSNHQKGRLVGAENLNSVKNWLLAQIQKYPSLAIRISPTKSNTKYYIKQFPSSKHLIDRGIPHWRISITLWARYCTEITRRNAIKFSKYNPVAAYIDNSFPGFWDRDIQRSIMEGRQYLLQHPSLVRKGDVDLDMVAEPALKNLLSALAKSDKKDAGPLKIVKLEDLPPLPGEPIIMKTRIAPLRTVKTTINKANITKAINSGGAAAVGGGAAAVGGGRTSPSGSTTSAHIVKDLNKAAESNKKSSSSKKSSSAMPIMIAGAAALIIMSKRK